MHNLARRSLETIMLRSLHTTFDYFFFCFVCYLSPHCSERLLLYYILLSIYKLLLLFRLFYLILRLLRLSMIVKCCCLLQDTHEFDLTKRKKPWQLCQMKFLTILWYEYATIHVCILVHINSLQCSLWPAYAWRFLFIFSSHQYSLRVFSKGTAFHLTNG